MEFINFQDENVYYLHVLQNVLLIKSKTLALKCVTGTAVVKQQCLD